MLKLIESLMSNNITLDNFIDNVIDTNIYKEEDIHNLLNSYNDEDHSAIVYLVLYYIYKFNFKQQNPFLLFLHSVENETDNDFTKEIKIHYKKDNIIIFQIDHLYFIINNSDESINVMLPNNLQNNYQFCINCNHELYFKEQLLLESFEFYIISDIK